LTSVAHTAETWTQEGGKNETYDPFGGAVPARAPAEVIIAEQAARNAFHARMQYKRAKDDPG